MKKKALITTSLVILSLVSAAAIARPLRANASDPTPLSLQFTMSSGCNTPSPGSSSPQAYCLYTSAPTPTLDPNVDSATADPDSVSPAPDATMGDVTITWPSTNNPTAVTIAYNSASWPVQVWPATINATITITKKPPTPPGPTPTPGPSTGYSFTVPTLPDTSTNPSNLDDSSSVNSAVFTISADYPTGPQTLTFADSSFQPGKTEYICQQYWPLPESIVLSSATCGALDAGFDVKTVTASILQYPTHPNSSPVIINYYSSAPTALTAGTITPVTVTKASDSQYGTTTISFPGAASTDQAVFQLEAVNTGLLTNPVLLFTMQAGQQLTFKLPYPTNNTQYNILGADSTDKDMIGPSPTNIITQTVASITLQKVTMPNLRVKNWPSYMAMGTLTDLSAWSMGLLEGTDSQPARRTDAIFKYAGNDGAGDAGTVYDPDTATTATIQLAKNIQAKTGHDVNPVLVIYTNNLSGGSEATGHSDLNLNSDNTINATSASITAATENTPPWDFGSTAKNPPCGHTTGFDSQGNVIIDKDILCMHYYNVITIAQQLQNSPIASVSGKGNIYGTIILNPDFIGSLHKDDPLAPAPLMQANNISVAKSLALAVNAYAKEHNMTAPALPSNFNNSANIAQYLQSLNWIVRTFGPNVTLGLQDNVWAGDGAAHGWLHTAVSDPSQLPAHINSEVQFLEALDVYTDANGKPAAYAPDFIAFDKYEHDDETAGVLSYAPYYYEAPVWDVYLSYVGGVSRALGNVPVMLWQIPGGHLRTTNDVDTRQQASTSADYFVGDPTLQPGLGNLASDLKQLLGTMNSITFFGSPGNTGITLFNSSSICAPNQLFASAIVDCQSSVLSWQKPHLYNALHSNVFAILWGGGQTTGIVGNNNVGGLNLDDNGWLSGRLKDYYANPIQLPDGS